MQQQRFGDGYTPGKITRSSSRYKYRAEYLEQSASEWMEKQQKFACRFEV